MCSFSFGRVLGWILRISLVSDLGFDGRKESFERGTGGASLQVTDFFVITVENGLVTLIDHIEVEVGLAVVGDGASRRDVLFRYDLWFFEAGKGGDIDCMGSVLVWTWGVLVGKLYHGLLERSFCMIEL